MFNKLVPGVKVRRRERNREGEKEIQKERKK